MGRETDMKLRRGPVADFRRLDPEPHQPAEAPSAGCISRWLPGRSTALGMHEPAHRPADNPPGTSTVLAELASPELFTLRWSTRPPGRRSRLRQRKEPRAASTVLDEPATPNVYILVPYLRLSRPVGRPVRT